jgi:hypothetical protein
MGWPRGEHEADQRERTGPSTGRPPTLPCGGLDKQLRPQPHPDGSAFGGPVHPPGGAPWCPLRESQASVVQVGTVGGLGVGTW